MLEIEKQVLIQVLLEKLACELCLDNRKIPQVYIQLHSLLVSNFFSTVAGVY